MSDQNGTTTPATEADWNLPDLAPARILNEFCYCPRLAYLEWVQGEFAHSADTLDGSHQHRRVDRGGGKLPESGETGEEKIHARSVQLSAPQFGMIAVIDVLESEASVDGAQAGKVIPVDYKRGEDQVLIFNLGPADGIRADMVEALGRKYTPSERGAVVV